MKKIFLIIILLRFCLNGISQNLSDSLKTKSGGFHIPRSYKPEIFKSGFIDIVNDGTINTSVRFLRLYIGEPGKFTLPLAFYGGASNNNFQSTSSSSKNTNFHLVNQFINPLTGLINISIDGIKYFERDSLKITRTGFTYQFGERVLTGYKVGNISDPETGRPINFLNNFGNAGLYFQTGAWDRNNDINMGIFWIVVRSHYCLVNKNQINKFLPSVKTNGFYYGFSLGFGIEIDKLVNIKAIYYKYLKAPEIEYGQAIYQFSFNYSLKK